MWFSELCGGRESARASERKGEKYVCSDWRYRAPMQITHTQANILTHWIPLVMQEMPRWSWNLRAIRAGDIELHVLHTYHPRTCTLYTTKITDDSDSDNHH